MEIVTLILSILVAAGFITCICLRISKKHRDVAYVVELISLVLLVVIGIIPVANGIVIMPQVGLTYSYLSLIVHYSFIESSLEQNKLKNN